MHQDQTTNVFARQQTSTKHWDIVNIDKCSHTLQQPIWVYKESSREIWRHCALLYQFTVLFIFWEDLRWHGKYYLFFRLDSLITSCMDFKQFRFTKTAPPACQNFEGTRPPPSLLTPELSEWQLLSTPSKQISDFHAATQIFMTCHKL